MEKVNRSPATSSITYEEAVRKAPHIFKASPNDERGILKLHSLITSLSEDERERFRASEWDQNVASECCL